LHQNLKYFTLSTGIWNDLSLGIWHEAFVCVK
jgi:hypothetical protein